MFNRNNSNKEGNSKFVKIGNIVLTKSFKSKASPRDVEAVENAIALLKEHDVNLSLNMYLPKGVDVVELDNTAKMLVSFKTFDNEPDWVRGRILLLNGE